MVFKRKSIKVLCFLSILSAILISGLADTPLLKSDVLASEYPLEVIHLAGEGFLISCSDKKVLVDALFNINVPPGLPPRLHDHLNQDQIRELERGEGKFTGIDAVLVTHHHDDHMTPGSLARFLEHNRDAILVCPESIVSSAAKEGIKLQTYGSRVKIVNILMGKCLSVKHQGIHIRALAMHHAYNEAKNIKPAYPHLVYYLDFYGKKVLHLGDAHVSEANFEPFAWLAEKKLVGVLVPYWFITQARGLHLIKRYLKPRQVIVMHHNAGNRRQITQEISKLKRKDWNIMMFTQYLQSIKIN
jgi:L-ascorbate metabolism protein UlaG (beta-lactamase superfamily)